MVSAVMVPAEGEDFHRGLVGLHGEQRLLGGHGVAHLDQHLDHGHVLEVADIGDLQVHGGGCAGAAARGSHGGRSCGHGPARGLQRGWRAAVRERIGGLQHHDHGAFLDLVAQGNLDFLDHASVAGGISMEALSDSTVIRDCSTLMVSPTLTSTSITPTSEKSPMSGTLISVNAMLSVSRS
jgi:hypothetical protein